MKFFFFYSARQSGKTTLLQSLSSKINAMGNYHALYCSLENASSIEDAAIGIPAIIDSLDSSLANYSLPNSSSFTDGIDLNKP
jgi:predicted AAA+ superfamily ATPase